MARLSHEVSAQIRFFAFFLSNSTLCIEILGDIDYTEILHEPSALEMIFAIFANTLEIDQEGKVLNRGYPERRAAQYIRTWYDPGYVVEPPFEPWETELYL